ncbi:hypothetical protein PACTADRAFT_49626 [Pachysolen tannophilus NRRL Y-2460]|uniref:RNA helicase n=1 Tax=Pachysolen tannophilus NRRL Y-2460 TaxID=669874 RepID=A0A1E4TWY9_PACTA|nr:hypothetical protein PACTADRAFT_49626 [Pachysolen tannophilus NRRL Y-2460]
MVKVIACRRSNGLVSVLWFLKSDFVGSSGCFSRSYSTRNKKLEVPSSRPSVTTPYKFGSYQSLKLPDEKKIQGLHKLTTQINDFNSLKLMPEIRNALINEIKYSTVLRNQNFISNTKKIKNESELNGLIIRPTPIQIAAIKCIQNKRKIAADCKVFTLAAETGSGKTWAYLAPLMDCLKQQEYSDEWVEKNLGSKAMIRSVILLPTHELVDQICDLLKNVDKELNLKFFKWDTNSNFKEFMEAYKSRIDIMVTTPSKLLSLTGYDDIGSARGLFHGVKFCAVDEADTLMDKSWVQDTHKVISYMQSLNTLVFVSATIPSDFNKTMERLFPEAIPITTPSLHRLPKAIDFKLINASVSPYKGSKIKALAQTLYAIHCDGTEQGYEKRVLIFVNEKEDVKSITGKLRHVYNHECYCVSGDDDIETRKEKIQNFINPPQILQNDKNEFEGIKTGLKILVCTDLLARGLNFSGIRNVILYDVPKTSIDLVHRAGRTGRMNQSGRVFMIVTDKDKSHVKGLPKVIRYGRKLG